MPELEAQPRRRRAPLPVQREDDDLEEFYTDAEHARQVFDTLLTAAELPRYLLIVHGVGGIGKSTLLKMYRLACCRRHVPVALIGGEDTRSSLDVLASWAGDLGRSRVKLPTFSKTSERYRALQAKVEARIQKANEVLQGAASELGKAGVKVAVEMAASTIPVAGPLAAALGGAGAEAAINWLRGILKKPDLDLYLDPAQQLTDDFVDDLAHAAQRRRLVLMIDTYEQMAAMDGWICDLARRLPPNVLLVVAGRAIPDWERDWPGWMARAEIAALEEMAPDDQRTLVHRYYGCLCGGEPDPKQVEAIVEFARGLPLAVTTVVRLWVKHGVEDLGEVRPQVVADLAERLLEGVPADMRPALEAAAVLRFFNADSLRALIDRGDADALYAELKRWPFIRPRHEGLAVHDTMREVMNQALAERTRAGFCALNERAAAYYKTRQAEMSGEAQQQAALEWLYHQLQADERQGVALLEQLFYEAERRWQPAFKRRLLDEVMPAKLAESSHRHRRQFLEVRMAKGWPDQEKACRELLREDVDDLVRARTLRSLGEALSFQHKPVEARACLEQALRLCEQLNEPIETAWARLELCWRIHDLDTTREQTWLAFRAFEQAGDAYGMALAELELGYNHLSRWQPIEAREVFARSMARQEQLGHRHEAAMARERIGQAYLIEGDFRRAIASKEQALKVFEELGAEWAIAWTLDELATCLIWTGDWERALACAQRAQDIFGEWKDHRAVACTVRQGEVYRNQGRFELALEAYNHALGETPGYNVWASHDAHSGRGYIHLARGEFDQALAEFEQAIKGFVQDGQVFTAGMIGDRHLGDLYLANGRLDDALQRYRSSLAAAESKGNHAFECLALVGMCQAYLKQAVLAAHTTLLARAEALATQYGYNHLLGHTGALKGHQALSVEMTAGGQLETVVGHYFAALASALRFNRFELDEILTEIMAHCRPAGANGQQVLLALRAYWDAGTDDQGVPLLEAERVARNREPGDGLAQMTVSERLEQALAQPMER